MGDGVTAEGPVGTAASAHTFDVREFARTAVGSHREHLDLAAFRQRPLPARILRTLRYLRDLERATMQHLRTVLVTPTHKDARVTAFLTTWAYEKYWIADALDAVASAHPVSPVSPPASGTRAWLREARDRVGPIRESLVGNTIGDDIVAAHLTAGAVDEWLTQDAYARVDAVAGHPELTRIISRVLEVKSRHLAFFEPQARMRLARSPRARALTRRRLRSSPWPLGSGRLPRQATAEFFDLVFGDRPGATAELDARVDALPGQEGLALVSRARRRALVLAEPAAERMARHVGSAAGALVGRIRR